VWKITEVTTTGPGGRTLTNLQPSILIYTPRYFSVTQIASESPRPDLPPPDKTTDKELADSVRPFAARAGTYEVRGNEITYHPVAAMRPNVLKPGFVFIDTFKFEGNDTLVIVPKAGAAGPVANPSTLS